MAVSSPPNWAFSSTIIFTLSNIVYHYAFDHHSPLRLQALITIDPRFFRALSAVTPSRIVHPCSIEHYPYSLFRVPSNVIPQVTSVSRTFKPYPPSQVSTLLFQGESTSVPVEVSPPALSQNLKWYPSSCAHLHDVNMNLPPLATHFRAP